MYNDKINTTSFKIYDIINLPNFLSLVRIALIPFIVLLKAKGKEVASAILILLSAITDVVDGYVARRYNMVTALGKALDPIADKLTILSIMVCLCIEYPIMIILLSIFLVKEIIMGIEGLIIIKITKTTYSAKWYGKISTILLYLTLIVHILFQKVSLNFTLFSVIISIISVLLSLVMYTILNVKKIISTNIIT